MPRQIELSATAGRLAHFALTFLAANLDDPETEQSLCRHMGQDPGTEDFAVQSKLLAAEIADAFKPQFTIDQPLADEPET